MLGKKSPDKEREPYDEPKQKEEVESETLTKEFTQYRVEINSGNETRIEYVEAYVIEENFIKLINTKPYVKEHYKRGRSSKNIPSRNVPNIDSRDLPPLIVNIQNVDSVNITEHEEFLYICEDVEFTQVYWQYKVNGEWQEEYKKFEKEKDDEYDIYKCRKSKWEGKK